MKGIKSVCCNNEVTIRRRQVKRKVRGSERNSSIERTNSAEGKRKRKCERVIDDQRQEKVPVMNLGALNKLARFRQLFVRLYRVLQFIFLKFFDNGKTPRVVEESVSLREKENPQKADKEDSKFLKILNSIKIAGKIDKARIIFSKI